MLTENPNAKKLAPTTPADVARCLHDANTEGRAVVPLGGGTMLDFGAPLERADLLLSLENLNSIIDYQPANLTVCTQAGITLDSLNRTLAEHGQYVPLDPACPDRATIGGIIASNSSGPFRYRYGAARDLLIGIRAALVDGSIVRGGGQVVKNVAGYDLPKLFIGSLGTLGVITEATFKLAPIPSTTATCIALFDNPDSAFRLVLRIQHSVLLPLSIELLNASAAANLGLGVEWALLVRFGGLPRANARGLADVAAWAKQESGTTADIEADSDLWARVRDMSSRNDIVLRASVLPTEMGSYLQSVEESCSRLGARCSSATHAIGISLIALDGEDDHILDVIEDLRAAAIDKRGHLVLQRAPLHIRHRADVWGPTRAEFAIMRKLKDEFDPHRILNPGRFIGGL